jgi:ice-binding like protein/exosortase sorting signal-containing protein
MLRRCMRISLGVLFIALLYGPTPALAQAALPAPNLNSEAPFAIVSSTFNNSNTAPQTIVTGNICFTTGPPITGPAPITHTGVVVTPCPAQVGIDQGNSTAFLNSQPCTSLGVGAVALNAVSVGANPPGTFNPGCYSSGGAMDIVAGTTVTLSGAGVYIFRSGGAITTGANSVVTTANGACASDVNWTAIGATSLGANAALSPTPTFIGNIFDAAGITIGHFANVTGRALAFGGTVTADANTITVPTCSTGAAVPTLSQWAMITLSLLLALAGAVAMRRRDPLSASK